MRRNKRREIRLSTILRVMKKAGAERVSDDACIELAKILEDISYNISKQAIDLAAHAGRDTIKAEDISFAAKHLND